MKRVVLLLVVVFVSVCAFAQDAAEKINQANEAMKGKDYAKAFELYESAMGNLGDVQVPDAINFNIGLAAYNSDNYEKAIVYFDKAVAADANVDKALEYIAGSYGKLEKYDEAVEAYKKAIEASSESASLSYNAGITSYKGKKYEAAVEFFSAAVEGGYKGETAQYYKAVCYNKLKDDAAYKTALEEGVAKFAGDDKLTSALAKVYVSEGNDLYKKGAAVLSAANQKVNDGAMSTADDAYNAEVAKAKEEFAAAIVVLEKAIAIDPSNANAAKLLEACNAVK
ncbi:tetratricopeptide repeat protein [Draconibacterium sp. IB214405]|uniref:tetratricopeptide repeat protein n=1 Tax=Draconibacterium sp. IB214405 TaxID=3097352 RepID=UPI002A0BB659|nr:tetratricopeptide repeat protein [Draconibacterium sp. IB214405]MDX8339508.1 tetratricopeptide repeat protein [Draconibacterium sp. IB214405]